MTRFRPSIGAAVAVVALLAGVVPASAQSLGTAHSYGVLGGSAVTAAGGAGTVISGDVGSSPTASVTGFPPAVVTAGFAVHPTNDAANISAQAAATALYASLSSGACTSNPGPVLSGANFTPGIHCFAATADLATNATFTLTGAGVFIFRVGSALNALSGSSVNLVGADPCTVFWQVTSAATLNGTSFAGNVIAQAGVSLGPSAALTGRAFATSTGPVTMAGSNTVGGCSAPIPPVCPAITLSPSVLPNGTVGVAYSQTILGSGGTAPYSFGVTSGALPAGVTLTSAGVVAGTPTTAGTSTFTIRGTDANACVADVAYTTVIAAAPPPPPVCPAITLSPSTLPNGTVGVAYSQPILGSGGTAPYSFGVTSGTLPAGVTLTSAGVVAGTPTTAGTSTFTIRGTDANACVADVAYTIVIAAAPPPPPVCPAIALSPSTLPNGTVGVAYSQTILGSGGTAPYSFGVTSGTLPAGVTLTSAGVLAGTPTTAGTSTFTIRGTDANACVADVAYTIVIAAAPPPPPVCPAITLSPTTLPNGTVGVAYSEPVVGSGGTAPYSFGVTAGALPGGVTLSSVGLVAGTPTTAGTSTFTIRGTDANGCFADVAYTIVIAAAPPPPPVCPAITIAPTVFPNGMVGVADSETLLGSGGAPPYSFGVTSGALPPGLTLTSAGVLAGTPTTAGTSTVTIRGTDTNGCFADVTYTIIIAAALPIPPGCPTITLTPSTLPNGIVGVAYSQTILGSGGTAPYRFGATSGTLPPGVTLTSAGVLAGTPTMAGTSTFTIRGTDANGCFAAITYTIVIAAAPVPPPVCPAITLAPPVLPNGTIGVAYSQTILGSGGTAPYTFGVTSGALPRGVTLTAAGVVAGTPTRVGTPTFTIRGTDASGCFSTITYTINILAAPAPPPVCPAITLSPSTLPNGTVSVAYSQTILASGGTAPYSFGVTSGVLPPGVTLTPAGVLAGTPTIAGTSIVTISGTDANGCVATTTFTVAIAAAPTLPPGCPVITLSPATLPNAVLGIAYTQTLTGSGGTGPYSFGVTSGALPPGLTLTAAGVLAGTPTVSGTSAFVIRGTDANGCFVQISFTLVVAASAVPTLPQMFVLLLAVGLTALGYVQLRRRARSTDAVL